MDSEVTILGLWYCDPSLEGMDTREKFRGDVWSISDWYRCYPQLPTIQRLYELHGAGFSEEAIAKNLDHGYFPGDWKKEMLNSESLHVWDDNGWQRVLGHPQTVKIDFDSLLGKYGEKVLSSTGSTMVCEAIDCGYECINIHGFSLCDDIYGVEAWGMLNAIEIAESKGVTVNAYHRDKWINQTNRPDCVKPDSYIRRTMKIQEEYDSGKPIEEIYREEKLRFKGVL